MYTEKKTEIRKFHIDWCNTKGSKVRWVRDWTDSDGLSKCRDLWLFINFIKILSIRRINFLVIFLLFFFSKKLKFSFLVKLSVTNSLAVIANLTKKIHFFFFYPLKSDHDKHFRFSIFFSSYIVELRTMDEKCFKRRVIQEITFFRSSSNLFFSHFPRI